MRFEWDEVKRATNLLKHGVDFADAVAVFFDDLAITLEDTHTSGERRFITIGIDANGRVLVIVYAYSDQDTIRIISARKANGRERQQYES